MKREKKKQIGIVSAIAFVAILIMLFSSGILSTDNTFLGQALKIKSMSKGISTTGMSTTTPKCTETDGGYEIKVKGTTTLTSSSASSVTTDSCNVDGTKLSEYHCSGDSRATTTISCTCKFGACTEINTKNEYKTKVTLDPIEIQQKSTKYKYAAYTCTDSDGGNQYYTAGTVELKASGTGTVERYGDSCYSNGVNLVELSCTASSLEEFELTQTVYTCPNGCKDGACVEVVSGSVS